MEVSDWVHTCHDMNKITGFVTSIEGEEISVCVTIPANYGMICIDKKDVWLADDTIWLDDIPILIDLSLMIRDKEWFGKWRDELALWKSIDEVDTLF